MNTKLMMFTRLVGLTAKGFQVSEDEAFSMVLKIMQEQEEFKTVDTKQSKTLLSQVIINDTPVSYFHTEYQTVIGAIGALGREKVLEVVNKEVKLRAKEEALANYRKTQE